MEKNVKNQTFNDCSMVYMKEIVEYNFENVNFVNCVFHQKIENCKFKKCKFINCKMYDTLFMGNTLTDCYLDNIFIYNNSSVRQNKFINTKINEFIVVALGLCYNEYTNCDISDISDLIVLRHYNKGFANPDRTVLSISNNAYHDCFIDFNSVIKLAKCNFGKIMMGGSRTKPQKDYSLYKYVDDNNCEVEWDFSDLSFEQRIYYIVALTIFFANVFVEDCNVFTSNISIKFLRTDLSDEIKFIFGDKYLDTTLIEPIASNISNFCERTVPLCKDVPNLLDDKYWKQKEKGSPLIIKK